MGKFNCSVGYYCRCSSGVDYCCLRNIANSGLLIADTVDLSFLKWAAVAENWMY